MINLASYYQLDPETNQFIGRMILLAIGIAIVVVGLVISAIIIYVRHRANKKR